MEYLSYDANRNVKNGETNVTSSKTTRDDLKKMNKNKTNENIW